MEVGGVEELGDRDRSQWHQLTASFLPSPFDKDDQPSAASTVNKASTVTKRFSTYSQSPPDTPSLREQAFYVSHNPGSGPTIPQGSENGPEMPFPLSQNMLRRQEELENGTAWSLSSESSDDSSSPQLSGTARHSSAPKPLVQQPEPLPIQVAFRRPQTPTSGPTDEEGAMAPVLANGHAPYSRTLSHISEASVDAALAEASVEAEGLESQGPNPPAHPDPIHREHPGPDPLSLDPGHSATSPTLSAIGPAHTSTDPVPSVYLNSLHKTPDSSSPELPGPAHTTSSSTCSAISPTSSAPSVTHTVTGSTHKPKPSTLTATGSTPIAMGSGQTTSHTHKSVLSTLTIAGPSPNTTGPVQTTSPSRTVTNLTNIVTSPTIKPILSTPTTTGPSPNTTSSVQTTSPSPTVTNLTNIVISPTVKPILSTPTTPGPTPSAQSPGQPTTMPTHTTTSPTHTTTSSTHTTASPTHKASMSTHTTVSPTTDAKDPVQTTRSPTHPVTSPTLITVNPSTSLDLATLPSPSAHTDSNPLSHSHPVSTPCTQADPIAPSTPDPSPACSSLEPLTSPSPDPPEPILQNPSPTPSPLTVGPQHPDVSLATTAQAPVPGAMGGAGDRRLEEALGALMAALDDYRGQFPELQGLEQEVIRLESLLMVRRAGLGCGSTGRAARPWQQL